MVVRENPEDSGNALHDICRMKVSSHALGHILKWFIQGRALFKEWASSGKVLLYSEGTINDGCVPCLRCLVPFRPDEGLSHSPILSHLGLTTIHSWMSLQLKVTVTIKHSKRNTPAYRCEPGVTQVVDIRDRVKIQVTPVSRVRVLNCGLGWPTDIIPDSEWQQQP